MEKEKLHTKNDSMFRILTIGTERALFEESPARERMREYAGLAKEMHIIVFNLAKKGRLKEQVFGNIHLYPTNSAGRLLYIFDAFLAGKKILSGKSWIISCQDPFESGLAGYLLKKFSSGNFLQLQAHTDLLSPFFWQESFLNKLRVILAKFLLKRADGIRVVSQRIKKSLEAIGIKKEIFVLPIFVDAAEIENAPVRVDIRKRYPKLDFIILSIARLAKEKNLGLLLEALAELSSKYPEMGVLLVGEGPEEKFLRKKAEKLGVPGKVFFEPWQQDLVSYYKTADVFALVSNYEGYGRTAIEAAAAGCPVVMTEVGCANEILKNNESALVIPVGDKEALKGTLTRLREEFGLKDGLRAAAKKTIAFMPDKKTYLNNYLDSWKKTAE